MLFHKTSDSSACLNFFEITLAFLSRYSSRLLSSESVYCSRSYWCLRLPRNTYNGHLFTSPTLLALQWHPHCKTMHSSTLIIHCHGTRVAFEMHCFIWQLQRKAAVILASSDDSGTRHLAQVHGKTTANTYKDTDNDYNNSILTTIQELVGIETCLLN